MRGSQCVQTPNCVLFPKSCKTQNFFPSWLTSWLVDLMKLFGSYMESRKRSFIMRDIFLKNMDGCTTLWKYSRSLIFNSSKKENNLHCFGNTFIFSEPCLVFMWVVSYQILVPWNIAKQTWKRLKQCCSKS